MFPFLPLNKTALLILISLISLTSQSLSKQALASSTMKVHPIPKRRTTATPTSLHLNPHKKLRRLPHVFSCVLELPLSSDADVTVLDSPDSFRFVISAAETRSFFFDTDVRAHAVEIHPGVTKIVVRESGDEVTLTLDELEMDMWRFRLPETTRPELSRAVLVDGELVVTVPKIRVENLDGEGFRDIGNRVVLVQ